MSLFSLSEYIYRYHTLKPIILIDEYDDLTLPLSMILRRTQSLCPICLRRLDASYEAVDKTMAYSTESSDPSSLAQFESIVLKKTCPEHGSFAVPIWTRSTEGEIPRFTDWSRPKSPSYPHKPKTTLSQGCPYDCGLCPEHTQLTCTGLVEVTRRCNLHCPVCYANAQALAPDNDPSLTEIAFQLGQLRAQSGRCTVQISGGEPSVRDDLPEIIALAAKHDFGLLQLNTNGLRLAEEAGYAQKLARAGLESVYLQFDGTSEATHRSLRGRALLASKRRAIEACAQARLGVVLVATIVKDVNDHELGDLLRLALHFGPSVRGLHLQPCAFFGRYPYQLDEAPRLTLPEVLARLTAQAPDLLSPAHFHPPGCEHELCSFSCIYQRTEHGLLPLPKTDGCSCREEVQPALRACQGAEQAKRVTQRNWRFWQGQNRVLAKDDFAAFLTESMARRRFTLSCMAFQDALSLDLARVRGCCIHVVQPDGRLVPFCLHNLTSSQGIRLYPQKPRPA